MCAVTSWQSHCVLKSADVLNNLVFTERRGLRSTSSCVQNSDDMCSFFYVVQPWHKCWLTSMAAAGAAEPSWLDSLIPSEASAGRYVYLVSFSRLLPEMLVGAQGGLRSLDELTRAEVAEFVREAFDNPAVNETGGGKPRVRETPLVRKVMPAAGEPTVC